MKSFLLMRTDALTSAEAERLRDFILRYTTIEAPSACPEQRLYLAGEMTPLWHATEDVLAENNLPPPFWAFAWAGGQGLARYLYEHPEIVAGKRVLDFAAGGGAVAIAAAHCGAAVVEAAEIDPVAILAIEMNAALNQVAVTVRLDNVLEQPGCPWDVVLAGDVCYERPMADAVTSWLRRCAQAGAVVLLADPGRSYLPTLGMLRVGHYVIPTSLELENETQRATSVYRIVG